jgi:hypothetical protein
MLFYELKRSIGLIVPFPFYSCGLVVSVGELRLRGNGLVTIILAVYLKATIAHLTQRQMNQGVEKVRWTLRVLGNL